jgi:hypothetical protein
LYQLLKASTTEEYESKFLDYKKEILDSVRKFVVDTTKELKGVSDNITSVQAKVGTDLEEIRTHLGGELAAIKSSLSSEIALLTQTVDRAIRPTPTATAAGSPGQHAWALGDGAVGPNGHRDDLQLRGKAGASHQPPPGGGTPSGQNFFPSTSNSSRAAYEIADASGSAPRVDLPQFDGNNSKLWQHRCEEYF